MTFAHTICESQLTFASAGEARSQFDFGRRVVEFPEEAREKRIEMIDETAFGDVQSVTVGMRFLSDAHVDIAVFDVDFERKHGTPGRFPLVFGVKCTKTVVAEEIAGVVVDVDVVVPVFLLASDEIPTSELFDGVIERFPLCEFVEIFPIEEYPMVTTPRTVGNTFEREIRIELHDRLTAGMDFDSSGFDHGSDSGFVMGYVLRRARSTGFNCILASGGHTRYI